MNADTMTLWMLDVIVLAIWLPAKVIR